ncbi:MAG: protein-L-isoaspartate O-methyltransferase [Alphaproteobacteria bacterium]|nr:protein-L-isoaspartate O-methyltransferase [Alphaproteobacteria bacterium]
MICFETQRFHMVECQLRPNKVLDETLLAAFSSIPREMFVEEAMQGLAYVDEDLPLTRSRTLMEPVVQARLLQALQLRATDKVLEIASGTGYISAILSRLAGHVVAIDDDVSLCQKAQQNLNHQDVKNVRVYSSSLSDGWPSSAPYQAIIIHGAVEHIPAPLAAQLAEGGRLACVVKSHNTQGVARLYQKMHGQLSWRDLFDAATPPLAAFNQKQNFAF